MSEISIIIPVYNIGEYLMECLSSVDSAINNTDTEVIIVDDGSDDNSAEIAQSFKLNSGKLLFYHKEHGGVGAARNYGISKAKGKYLAFVDGDDIVSENLYSEMIYLAEKHDVNMVVCNAANMNENKKARISPQFQRLYMGPPQLFANITKKDSLIYDAVIWNKLIRRDFWSKYNISFPVSTHYEDMIVALKLYLYSGRVAMLQRLGYFHRLRAGDNPSITQQLDDINNLADRIEQLKKIIEFIDKHAAPESKDKLKKNLERRILCWDFEQYFSFLRSMEKDSALHAVSTLADFYTASISPETINTIPVYYAKEYEYILEKNVEKLIRLNNHKKLAWSNAPVYDIDQNKKIVFPEDIYGVRLLDADKELQYTIPLTSLYDMEISGDHLFLNVALYYPRINLSSPDDQSLIAYVFNEHTGEKVYPDTERIETKWLSKEKGALLCHDDYRYYDYNYDNAGLYIKIDLKKLASQIYDNNGNKQFCRWYIYIEYENRLGSGTRVVRGIENDIRDYIRKTNICFEYNGDDPGVSLGYDARETFFIVTRENNDRTD